MKSESQGKYPLRELFDGPCYRVSMCTAWQRVPKIAVAKGAR
jgi:hypothetical protein